MPLLSALAAHLKRIPRHGTGVGLSLQGIYVLPDCSSQALPRHRPALESLRFSSPQTIFLSKVSHFTPALHQGLPHVPRKREPPGAHSPHPTAAALSLLILLTCSSESLRLLTICLSARTSATFLDK